MWHPVEGAVVGEAQLTFAFAKVTHPKLLERRREALEIWLGGAVQDPE